MYLMYSCVYGSHLPRLSGVTGTCIVNCGRLPGVWGVWAAAESCFTSAPVGGELSPTGVEFSGVEGEFPSSQAFSKSGAPLAGVLGRLLPGVLGRLCWKKQKTNNPTHAT
eukprot:1191173-Prorocentrum_minimum.AAC.1